MSSQPRPLVRKPGVAGKPGTVAQTGPSIEELRGLPAFLEEGEEVDINPENASAGRITDETVTIVDAKFKHVTFERKDGTFPTFKGNDGVEYPVRPKTFIEVSFGRSGGKTYKVDYEYALGRDFAPSKDGLTLKVRPTAKREGYVPRPRKGSPGVLFLQSLADSGVKVDGKTGLGPLKGLTVHVRNRTVEGRKVPVLLVDFVAEGDPSKSFSPASAAAPEKAPAVHAETEAPAVDIDSIATDVLVQILSDAGGSIARSAIATTLIKMEGWGTDNPSRGAVLKKLREDAFIKAEGSPWVLEGSTVKLA